MVNMESVHFKWYPDVNANSWDGFVKYSCPWQRFNSSVYKSGQ